MRPIDADALLKQLAEVAQRANENAAYTGDRSSALTWDMAVKYVKNAPTLEQRKGKWIVNEDDDVISGTCSCCGWNAILFETDVIGMPFCPKCGAKMEGEE